MSGQPKEQTEFGKEWSQNKKTGPVECLGMTFENDDARREYFLNILQEKLKDPEFRKIEGFPIGKDEDILALSDPPYYTACPNPFIEDFINQYGKPYDPNEPYSREPFATDVSEGKNDPIYNAHSYHTKVPHKAIMRYILHYTEPGDVVFDGFCGTGMTGVAAQLCGDRKTIESLGYRVLPDGTILDNEGKSFSKLGARYAILNDLSPAATFIAYNYNTPVDVHAFEQEARRILKEVEDECGWMYNTLHVEPASSRLKEITGFNAENSKIEPAESVNNVPAGSRHYISSFTQRRDNLPHWQLPGAFYFLTFNTHNRRILSEKSRDIVLQSLLYWSVEPASSRQNHDFSGNAGKLTGDTGKLTGSPLYNQHPRIKFIAAVVMPDHIHAVIQPLEKSPGAYWDLSDIMHSIKSYSANEINKVEGTIGQTVWQTETYDHIIRNDREYGFVLQYIANNPVVEGLAEKPEDYIWFKVSERVEEAGWKPTLLGKINYTVWSDVFVCPECTKELVFWECAVDKYAGEVMDEFRCPNCGVKLTKRDMERAWVTKFDKAINQTIKQARQVPVLINYTANGKRYEKIPDDFDHELMDKIEKSDIPYWSPTDRMPEGDESRRNDKLGMTHVHHFYTKRNLWILSAIRARCNNISQLLLLFNSQLINISKMNRYRPDVSFPYNPLSGTLYIASQICESDVFTAYQNKVNRLVAAYNQIAGRSIITCQSTDCLVNVGLNYDYIFTDPPFGGNLMYSELNFIWEAWLKVFTNNKSEAIENKVQGKGLAEYQELMTRCFEEYYRVLKPGRWMTVEFHNSKNSVWNAIQEGLQRAGFVIADVRTLDKQQGSFKQVTSASAVKQDLIISAYKPNSGLEERFRLEAGTEEGVWDFIRTHLKQLPVFVTKDDRVEIIAERQNFLLFDRMVAFHVQRGFTVPLSAADFYAGLAQRFPERDGMYFLPEQAVEYDKKRMKMGEDPIEPDLFVFDESSAIQWLRRQLFKKPQTFQEIHPQFLRELGGWNKNEKPLELMELLHQNFLRYDGNGEVSSQIHGYLSTNYKDLRNLAKDDPILRDKAKDRWYVPDTNKASDLEKLREKSLLRDFEEYRDSKQKRLRIFRLEAVRAGFKKAWQERDYKTIIDVASKIPENVLQEDQKLLMWYDQAMTRAGSDKGNGQKTLF